MIVDMDLDGFDLVASFSYDVPAEQGNVAIESASSKMFGLKAYGF